MRVFLVEDNLAFIEPFFDYASANGVMLEVASNLRAALERIDAGPDGMDLAICDLKIPSEQNGLDDEVEHGLTALNRLLSDWPGVPVIVVSAFGTLEVMAGLLIRARQEDLYGSSEPVGMLRFEQKANLANAISMVNATRLELEALSQIELVNVSVLRNDHQMTLRVFGRRRGAALLNYQPLSGGRSGARTGLATARDHVGVPVAHVVAKMTTLSSALEERDRYQAYISGRLGAGTYANMTDSVLAGCHGGAGIFYSVADTYDRDLFAVLRDDPIRAAIVVKRVAEDTRVWTESAPQAAKTWREVRSVLLSDAKYTSVVSEFGVDEVPEKSIQTVWGPQHGDLHPANVLVDNAARPVLIDFGRTEPGPSVLDPLTLELSVTFHPDSPFCTAPWPSNEQLMNWEELDAYLLGCPFPDFIRACREWASSVGAGKRDLYAVLNAYCLRNLYFAELPSDRALALQKFAAGRLRAS